MSNTRYHSIGLKVKEKQSNPGRQSDDRMGENSRRKANLKKWVLSFEQNYTWFIPCLATRHGRSSPRIGHVSGVFRISKSGPNVCWTLVGGEGSGGRLRGLGG